MKCSRAAAVLRGLEKNELDVVSDEIEELLALDLAVEADPDDVAIIQWLQPIVREHAGCNLDDPQAAHALAMTLQATEEELSKDWYRMKTSKAALLAREESRVAMRRALAFLNDLIFVESAKKVWSAWQKLAPSTGWVCCQKLGSELYGITYKGWRVRRQLKIRLDRYGDASFESFVGAFDKTEAKMRAFGQEIAYLNQNIGYVKKNREQIVIGLAKTRASAPQAVGTYYAALQAAPNAPHVAVTCTRNAQTFGSPSNVVQRLQRAEAALRQAGFPATPIAMGAAKTLLPFEPPEAGVPRFVEIYRRLEQTFARGDVLFKYTARLMPATGTPDEVVRRVLTARTLLTQFSQATQRHPQNRDSGAAAVALGSLVRDENTLPAVVRRFCEIEIELVRAGVSTSTHCEGDALECVACPGTPIEVVDIVSSLAAQLAYGRRTERSDVAVAAAFAKRFSL